MLDVKIKGEIAPLVNLYRDKWLLVGKLEDIGTRRWEDKDFAGKVNKRIGLYRFRIKGVVVYIGKTVEAHNRSYWKRMAEYINYRNTAKAKKNPESDSAINYINKYASLVIVEFLLLGDENTSRCDVEMLEAAHIYYYDPPLNKQFSKNQKNVAEQAELAIQMSENTIAVNDKGM